MNSFRPLFLRIVYFRPRILKHRDPGTVNRRDDFEIGPARTRQAPYQGALPRNVRPGTSVTLASAGVPSAIAGATAPENADLIQGFQYIGTTVRALDIPENRSGKNPHIRAAQSFYL
jgi:hypothetical protein